MGTYKNEMKLNLYFVNSSSLLFLILILSIQKAIALFHLANSLYIMRALLAKGSLSNSDTHLRLFCSCSFEIRCSISMRCALSYYSCTSISASFYFVETVVIPVLLLTKLTLSPALDEGPPMRDFGVETDT